MKALYPHNPPFAVNDFAVVAMREHAKVEWPKESCGVLKGGVYIPCENLHQMPKEAFRIDPRVSTGADAIIHSHCMPFYHSEPSEHDMRVQQTSRIPWGIIHCSSAWASKPMWFGDFRLLDPLVGRQFVSGVYDCYSLIRAYYWQTRQVVLREYPRDRKTVRDRNLYEREFQNAGFVRVDEGGLQEGDGLLMMMISGAVHHAGIYIGNNQILHHLWDNPSKVSPYYLYKDYVRFQVRFNGQNDSTARLTG